MNDIPFFPRMGLNYDPSNIKDVIAWISVVNPLFFFSDSQSKISTKRDAEDTIMADWWLVDVNEDTGEIFYYDLEKGWQPGLLPSFQGALFYIEEFRVTSPPSSGSHTFYFGFDLTMNGSLDMDAALYSSESVVRP